MDILHHQYSKINLCMQCIHTEAEPGPPLKEITNGREARSLTSERS
jgi:hypothetical protein